MGAIAPIAPTKRKGIQRELYRFPKGVPSCAVPATDTANTHINKAEMMASATMLKALNISSMNSAACDPPRPCPHESQPWPSKESKNCLLASLLSNTSEVAGISGEEAI